MTTKKLTSKKEEKVTRKQPKGVREIKFKWLEEAKKEHADKMASEKK